MFIRFLRSQPANIYLILSVCVLVSGCVSYNASATTLNQLSAVATPIGIAAPVCRLVTCTNFNPVPNTQPFTDTWNNIHLFQIFDYNVSDFATIAKNYDFVWGARPSNVAEYRSLNPKLMLSYYMPLRRDDGPTFLDSQKRSLDYWKQVHPDWILYKCDRKTPAYEDFNDHSTSIPFMLSNPAVRAWQIETYIKPASGFGYDALAVDNVQMENLFGGCGYYDADGNWVQRYTGQDVDPQWQADIASWITQMQQTLHTLPHPMLLMINFSFGAVPLDSEAVQQVLAHSDGVLDEAGFNHYGDYYLSGNAWLQEIHFIDQQQNQNRPYFSINEFQHGITQNDIQWSLASYLMCKQHLAMVSITHFGAYGGNLDFSEYAIPIGNPQSEMYFAQNAYWRDYTGGEVIVNPNNTPFTITLPSSKLYVDAYGTHVPSSFVLPAKSGKILLSAH